MSEVKAEENGLEKTISHKKVDLSFDPKERQGLTTAQAEELYITHGYNELPEVTISLVYVFFLQFTGTMPYMMELAAIIAIAVQDYADFGIIVGMLCSNAIIGFQEQLKAANSLRELTQQMEQKIAVLRDGHTEYLLTRLLVPGDVVLLIGGAAVPADIEWLEGDVLSVDTAALTGEPIPRKYPCDQYGKLILAGTTIRAGEAYGIVRKTGIDTEIGSASHAVSQDKSMHKISLFEQRVLLAVKIIIALTLIDVLIIFLIQGIYKKEFTPDGIRELLLTCLSIIVASIPIALPIVINVTMALGAGLMAREFNAVVTSLPALQDISAMTILCSDKTGTLTTAKISIHAESVWTNPNGKYSQRDVALYAALSSSRDKKEDAIDRSVIQHFDRIFGPAGITITNEYTKVRNVGFNPIYKRVIYEFTHPEKGRLLIAKGLPSKVLNTSDGGIDDAVDQWQCQDFATLNKIVSKVDFDLSKAGYKTLGVAVKFNEEAWEYVGILPMLDPPRHDTALTIMNLKNAGIGVKMITGDHLNIAKETARLIGMGTNIRAGEETRDEFYVDGAAKYKVIREADGFAQVLPRDKREVVNVLRNTYQQVVGMTGDGVNDAPALSAAQCGIAVDDATDAAKNAAAIILTSPGLSAVYSAVVESRRIFRKLKSYITYRFAASIQIVIVLTLFIYISNCSIDALLIILLALFNDLTLLPIAYDNQQASSLPDNPDVANILALSATLGAIETSFSMLFAYASGVSHIFYKDYEINHRCLQTAQGAIWLQLFLSTEFLIFSARAPSYVFFSVKPSPLLAGSVLTGCFIASLMAGFSERFGKLPGADIVIIWAYCFFCFLVIDVIKVQVLALYKQNMAVLVEEPKDEEKDKSIDEDEEPAKQVKPIPYEDPEIGRSKPDTPIKPEGFGVDEIYVSRANTALKILHDMTVARGATDGKHVPQPMYITAATKLSSANVIAGSSIAADRLQSAGRIVVDRKNTSAGNIVIDRRISSGNDIVVNRNVSSTTLDLRSTIISGHLRPNTPANKAMHK